MSVDKEKIRHGWSGLPGILRGGLLLLAIGILGLLLFTSGRALLSRWHFFESTEAAEKRAEAAEIRAKAYEERALEAEAKSLELDKRLTELATRAQVAEEALDAARNITVRVRQNYAAVKARDVSTLSGNVDDLCRTLASAGYPCRQAETR